MDRLSSLSWDVLDNILGKLSIVDAARTSVLAKDWRYKWLGLSKFVLNTADLNLSWDQTASLINYFMIHHSNAILHFSLEMNCSSHYPDLYQWIQYLSKQNIEVMILTDFSNDAFVIPSYLFMFEKLKYLSLDFCVIRIPSSFGGFSILREL